MRRVSGLAVIALCVWAPASGAAEEGASPSISPATSAPAAEAPVPQAAPLDEVPSQAPATGPISESPEAAEALETVVYARPDRPTTGWRVSGGELARRGAETLADALDLMSHARVRLGGRGDMRVDLRGSRQGALRVFVDGVPMEDPYLGRFDVGSVPISDVVEIRVNASPLSPIDGMGGAGGSIEVDTLSGSGPRLVEGRVRASVPMDGTISATGRQPFSETSGIRVSASARATRNDLPLNRNDGGVTELEATTHLVHSGVRLERQTERLRLTADVAAYHRCQWVPPGEELNPSLQRSCPQRSIRSILGARWSAPTWTGSATLYGLLLDRTSGVYADPEAESPRNEELLTARRVGGALQFERALGPGFRASARMSLEGETATLTPSATQRVEGSALTGEPAVAVFYESGRLRSELAVGAALPLGTRAPAWPEAKGLVELSPGAGWKLWATGGRKGRVPTLRERFQPGVGNPALGAELHTYMDVGASRRGEWLTPRVLVYHRWTQGLIQLSPDRATLVNLERARAVGLEAALEFARRGPFGGGVAYSFLRPTEPLENQPAHQGDVYFTWRAERAGALVRLQWVGERPESGVILPAYVTLDTSAWWRLSKAAMVTMRANNLLDERYHHRASLLAFGRIVGIGLDVSFE